MKTLLCRSLALACAAGLSFNAQALDILLTNDDGCRAPGIDAMYQALTAAGHRVTLVGPLHDSSGISAASVVIPGQVLAVTQLAEQRYCVGPPEGYQAPAGKTSVIGTPVDAVNVGLDVLLKDRRPDLVVSGSNFGENVGPLTQMSGTLNAAVRAMFKGIPAVAVSTGIDIDLIRHDPKAGYAKTQGAMGDTAAFATRVIALAETLGTQARERCRSEGRDCQLNVLGLPGVSGLNINYPPLAAAAVKGVKFAPIGQWDTVNFTAQRGPDGVVRVNLVAPTAPTQAQQAQDAWLLSQGNAVISVIAGNLGASDTAQEQAQQMLQGLEP